MAEGNFGDTLLYLVALVFSIVFHEVSHGFVADRHGDPTARLMGRLTLNPIPHIDPWGSIILPAIRPVLAIALLIRGLDLFRLFDVVWALTKGGPGTMTETV